MYYMHIILEAHHTPSILGTSDMAGVSKPNLPISSAVGSRFTLTSFLSSIQSVTIHIGIHNYKINLATAWL